MTLTGLSLKAVATAIAFTSFAFAFSIHATMTNRNFGYDLPEVNQQNPANPVNVFATSQAHSFLSDYNYKIAEALKDFPTYADRQSQFEVSLLSFFVTPTTKRSELEMQTPSASVTPPVITSPPGASAVEQKNQGARPGAELVD